MSATRRFLGRISLVSLVAIAACSTPPPPPPPTPPPPVVPTIRPTPPDNAVEGMSIPEKGADGKYLTANRGVTANTALWHVRMALNVAALNCDKYGPTARTQYNQILSVHRDMLDSANDAVDRNYTAAYGSSAVGMRERLNTVVYNFFALPPVIKHFCPVAVTVGAKLLSTPSSQMLVMAPEWLAELEKPFQDFYEAYADYLRRLAEWQSRFGATVTLRLSPAPLPPPPVPPGEAPVGWKPGMALPPSSLPPAPMPAPAASGGATVQPVPSASAPAPAGPPAPAQAVPGDTPFGPPPVTRTLPGNGAPTLSVQPLPAGNE
ncbi:hypothetical protein SAMIE_1022000 [Sphingobium amiense]|uniref:DUF4142 domain-containing protein n=1 Tax=Sphingobium amiense TaxID=135719 RepID=A0A494WE35_9SPHN|nr:hypothetical protein [Sphingobium amiense]BBD98699.1 hypothetical protein SAMIE_1022000 [Sphingobium amiense]